MKEGNGRARALWYGDWWGSPHLFPSPRMAQTQEALTRTAWCNEHSKCGRKHNT